MTWSFSEASLSTSEKDQVRLLIGDTDTSDQLISDEAITFYLSQRSNVNLAAADA